MVGPRGVVTDARDRQVVGTILLDHDGVYVLARPEYAAGQGSLHLEPGRSTVGDVLYEIDSAGVAALFPLTSLSAPLFLSIDDWARTTADVVFRDQAARRFVAHHIASYRNAVLDPALTDASRRQIDGYIRQLEGYVQRRGQLDLRNMPTPWLGSTEADADGATLDTVTLDAPSHPPSVLPPVPEGFRAPEAEM